MSGNRKGPQVVLDLAQAHQEIARLQGMLFNRAMPTLGNMVDALSMMTVQAGAGNPEARANLQAFFRALDAARAACSGIVTAHEVPAEIPVA